MATAFRAVALAAAWAGTAVGNATSEPIGPFDGEWRFLSNFFPAEVMLDGVRYASVEHAFQAAKVNDHRQRELIRTARTPGEAKRLSRQNSARDDWLAVRDAVMLDLLRQKFRAGSLRDRLLATTGRPLVEVNEWGDTYWGVCKGVGRNRLGELLQLVRSELTCDEVGTDGG